jgi:hypothetical protein
MWHLLFGGKRVHTEKAKAILQHYRPSIDAEDPYFSEALEQVQRDPALAQWFIEHCANYETMRRTLCQISVPVGLHEEILKAHVRQRPGVRWTHPAFVAPVAVALIVLAIIVYGLYARRSVVMQPRDFAAYLQTMTRVATGRYKMTVVTTDPDILRHHLADAHGPADYSLTPALRTLSLEGGLVVDWFGHKVSMLCFTQDDKQDKDANEDHDVWLFVVSRDALPDVPTAVAPQFTPAHGLITASWTSGDKVYLLATRGAQAELQRLL